jgi:hypothetical protein
LAHEDGVKTACDALEVLCERAHASKLQPTPSESVSVTTESPSK